MLITVCESLQNNPSTEMITATFHVTSKWNGGCGVTSSSKNFSLGARIMERSTEFKMDYHFPMQFSGEGSGPTVCEACIGSLAACLIQTIAVQATSRGIQLDSIDIDVEGDVDLHGFTGIDSNVIPGAQQFRINLQINSNTASKEQINELYEIGKGFPCI
jgi:uncharacterized OsmC-like protein